MTASNWLTLTEAAELAGVSTKTIRRRIADNSLIARRMGPKLVRVDRRSVENFGTAL
ncbi:helix-turn-helix domain-containing protein [Microbacterium sp. A82]|uniref:helix-turn-helix domain-containing protein n=1 Tax=Microbacterium sp. A82 TaxID=3450452 RepID=UPI003F2CB3D0